jgi:hypothetical protein
MVLINRAVAIQVKTALLKQKQYKVFKNFIPTCPNVFLKNQFFQVNAGYIRMIEYQLNNRPRELLGRNVLASFLHNLAKPKSKYRTCYLNPQVFIAIELKCIIPR